MGQLGRLPHRRPGRLPVAYTNSERPVTTINHDPTERLIRALSAADERVPAETACEIPLKTSPRKRHGGGCVGAITIPAGILSVRSG